MSKTILFDVDGTLVDTEEPIIKSLQKTLKGSFEY
jgi:Predicted phosphatases